MRQKWRILTLRGSANNFICHFCAQAKSSADLPGANRVEPQPSKAAKMETSRWRVDSRRMNTSARSITRSQMDPLCRKVTGQVTRRCANSTCGVLASPHLGDPGVVPRKNEVVIVHITEKISGEYACLTASSNMLLFLREELTNLPKMVRTAFGLPIVDPQPKGALHAFGRVWEWSNHAHEAFSCGYVHERAIFGRCNTRHCAFRSMRGRW